MSLHARTVGVVRLSRHSNRADDPSTSPERQRKVIEGDPSLTLIGWAVDLGVSAAKIPPWDRPELGGWLRRPEDWDTLAFWKLDRLVRSVGDFAEMIKWSQGQPNSTGLPPVDRPKNLVSIADKIDLSTPTGKAMAQITAVFAELEAAIIKERVNAARTEMYVEKRWPGGRYPYGYRPARLETGGWALEIDPEAHAIVTELVDRVIAGEPAFAVQLDLQSRGVPTPKGGKSWGNVNVSQMLRSRALLGEATYKAVTSGEGVPIDPVRADPLVTFEQWNALQEVLSRAGKRERVTGASMLLDVAFCALCGSPMYRRHMGASTVKGRVRKAYMYYGCGGRWSRRVPDCEAKSAVRGDKLHPIVERLLLAEIGPLEIRRTVKVAGVSHAAEIRDLETALEDLLARSAGKGDAVARVYAKRIEAVEGKLAALAAIPERAPSVREVGTGETYAERWAAASEDERHQLLKASGIRVEVAANQGGPVRFGLFDRPEGYAGAVAFTVEDGAQVAVYLPRELAERATGNAARVTYTTRPLPPFATP